MRCFIAMVPFALAAAVAHGEPCAVSGDVELGGTIAAILATRGIDATRCAGVHPRVERRADALVVANDTIERSVNDPATAATVIESWVRADLAAPLMQPHAVAIEDPLPSMHEVASTAAPARGHRVHASALVESSLASDGSIWFGPSLGACIELGPICAASRLRFAKAMVDEDVPWRRVETELLIGGDIPLHVGRLQIVPGFGGGIGMIGTHVRHEPDDMRQYLRTGGLRGDAHVAVELPLGWNLALAVTFAVDMVQGTHVESSQMPTDGSPQTLFPAEPWLIGRFGVGVRYGGL